MQDFDNIYSIGLMCDTSLEGIDAALIKTNGLDLLEIVDVISRPYDEYLVSQIKEIRGKDYGDFPKKLKKAEFDFTMANAQIVNDLISHAGIGKSEISVIGFHGLTLYHNPFEGETFQLGDASMLASETTIPTVSKFRKNDIYNGGYGGPLTPIYLATLYAKEEKPLAILNISGFSNITLINENERLSAGLIAPGMALLNDFMVENFDMPMDYDGQIAAKGNVDEKMLELLLDDEFFEQDIPKSVERSYFNRFFETIRELDKKDAMATLTELIATVIINATKDYPKVIFSGGGTKNPTLMRAIKTKAKFEIVFSSDIGINPKMMESQAYAYLAVRNLYNLPASYPETTGANSATICGSLYTP